MTKLLVSKPSWMPSNPSVKGSKLLGIKYEAKVINWLRTHYDETNILAGPWFEYEDERGLGWASPDFIVLDSKGVPVLIGEVKLSFKDRAETKLRNIYQPLIEYHFQCSGTPLVQVTNSLNKRTPIKKVVNKFDDAFLHEYSIFRLNP